MLLPPDTLAEVDVLLEQPAPGGHVDVHLVRPGHRALALLPEDLPLAPQLGLPRDEGVEELDLGENILARL